MTGDSRELRSFLESLAAPRTDRRYADDFDLAALGRLGEVERERAERLLLARLERDPSDARVPGALAIVGRAAAVAPLDAALPGATGWLRFRIASALAELDAEFDPQPCWLELLACEDSGARAGAALALAAAPGAAVQEALLEALFDAETAVRACAFGALVRRYRLEDLETAKHGPLRAISTRLISSLEAVARPAADEARALFRALEAGRMPRDLGLAESPSQSESEVLDRFVAALGPGAADLDLDALSRLEGPARHWVESLLLGRLDQGEERVLEAAARLCPAAAVEAVRAARRQDRGPFRDFARGARMAVALERMAGDGSGRSWLEDLLREGAGEPARRALAALESASEPGSRPGAREEIEE